MKSSMIRWLGIALIVETGLLHLYATPHEAREVPYLGIMFAVNLMAAVISAQGIFHGRAWGWILGGLIAAGSIVGYGLSRTVGLPGAEIEEWFNLVGLISLVVEGAFLFVLVLARPWDAASPALNDPILGQLDLSRYLVPATAVLFVILTSFAAYRWDGGEMISGRHELVTISQQDLEEEYGLQIALIAPTAMDSIVDVRLKVLDVGKARRLLEGRSHMPALMLDDNADNMIMAARMSRHGNDLKAGGLHVMFFPNRERAVHIGTPVSVVFGNVRLEPIAAQ